MRYVCQCGWPIHGIAPFKVTCGQCYRIVAIQHESDVSLSIAKPPRWVQLLQRLSKPQDIGLGATVKRIAAKVGGERFKAWSTKIGLPCGCTEREAEWNRLYTNSNYRQP